MCGIFCHHVLFMYNRKKTKTFLAILHIFLNKTFHPESFVKKPVINVLRVREGGAFCSRLTFWDPFVIVLTQIFAHLHISHTHTHTHTHTVLSLSPQTLNMVICTRLWLCAILSVLSRALGFSQPQVMPCFDITSYMIVQSLERLKRSNGQRFLILVLGLQRCTVKVTTDCVNSLGILIRHKKAPFAVNWSHLSLKSDNFLFFSLPVTQQHHYTPLSLFAFKSVDLHCTTALKSPLTDRGNLLNSLL